MLNTSSGALRAATSRPAWYGGRRRPSVQVGCQQQAVKASKSFFNRTNEQKELNSLINSEPLAMHVVVGPRNCGKTRFIRHCLDNKPNAIYIDCRVIDPRKPQVFITELLEKLAVAAPADAVTMVWQQLEKFAPMFAQALFSAVKVTEKMVELPGEGQKTVTVSFAEAFKGKQTASSELPAEDSFRPVYKALQSLLDAWGKDIREQRDPHSQWPVLVIDEVNMLTAWKDVDPKQLSSLLALLVAISKQQKQCHVLLLTSEYGFQSWLQREIDSDFFETIVIGDFSEQDARQFLNVELKRQLPELVAANKLVVEDTVWCRVYQVCGGNAGNLLRLVQQVSVRPPTGESDWFAALEQLCRRGKVRIQQLAPGGDDFGWTSVQYATAVQALLQNQFHAVPELDMKILLGRCEIGDTADTMELLKVGEQALDNLVAANALSLRPYSRWATDIPAEAFVYGGDVVTAPSTMALYCMQSVQQVLKGLGQNKDGIKEANLPSKPFSSPERRDLQNSIEEVQATLDKFSDALGAQVPTEAGDKDMVANLLEQVLVLQAQVASLQSHVAASQHNE